jgi:hypothetical protein
MSYTAHTLKKLFALSGNVCAFPNCPAPIVDTDSGVVVGDICHIKGRSEGGPRYDPDQTEEERNGYENLLLMCVAHNRIVDGKKTREQYPVERLQEFKRNHEAKYQGSVVDEAASGELIEHFTVAGSVITTYHQSGGQNANTIHNVYAYPPGAEREAAEEDRAWALFAEFSKHSREGYIMNPEIGSEQHRLAERLVSKGMLERLQGGGGYAIPGQQFVIGMGPKAKAMRDALRKIYAAARDFAGESGDPTDVTIYLADTPITGKRGVELENAYNVARSLEKNGLLTIENHEAIEVRLTDDGVREATRD